MPTLRVVNLLDINSTNQHLVIFRRRRQQHHDENKAHHQEEDEHQHSKHQQNYYHQHHHGQEHDHAVIEQSNGGKKSKKHDIVRQLVVAAAAPTKIKQDEEDEKTRYYHQHQLKQEQQEQLLGEEQQRTTTPPAKKNGDDDTAATDLIFSPASSSRSWSPATSSTTMMLPDTTTISTNTTSHSKNNCKERHDNIALSKEQKEKGEEGSMMQFIINADTDQKNDNAPAIQPVAAVTTNKIENPTVETATSISGSGSFNSPITIDDRIICEMLNFVDRAKSVLMHNTEIKIASSNDGCKNNGEHQSNAEQQKNTEQQRNNEHQRQEEQQQETHDERLSPEQNVLAAISPESMMETQKKKCKWCPVCYTWNGLGSSSAKTLKRERKEMKEQMAKKKLKKNISSTDDMKGGLRQGTSCLQMSSKKQAQSANQPSESEMMPPPRSHTNGSISATSCLHMRNKQQNCVNQPPVQSKSDLMPPTQPNTNGAISNSSSWRPLFHANQPYQHPGKQIYPGYYSEPPRTHVGRARPNYSSYQGWCPCCPPHCTDCASQRHRPSCPPPQQQDPPYYGPSSTKL